MNNLDYSITSLGIFHISSFHLSILNSGILNKEQSIKADERHTCMYTNMQKVLKPLLLTMTNIKSLFVYMVIVWLTFNWENVFLILNRKIKISQKWKYILNSANSWCKMKLYYNYTHSVLAQRCNEHHPFRPYERKHSLILYCQIFASVDLFYSISIYINKLNTSPYSAWKTNCSLPLMSGVYSLPNSNRSVIWYYSLSIWTFFTDRSADVHSTKY